ncbi:hypothetical protein LH428_14370 [Laribacter hongkongensis]|uniref:hypothetical protein n=1 Tax=Laribacter hongkongensis TaxID=168471 RepID=UPI001EFDA962|nr:hypothetical protein [Laribacter hongkongensis]MCG9116996.1 hypothetical protein [Laribacter hongkongensis]
MDVDFSEFDFELPGEPGPEPVTQEQIEMFGLFDDGAMDWDAAVAGAYHTGPVLDD